VSGRIGNRDLLVIEPVACGAPGIVVVIDNPRSGSVLSLYLDPILSSVLPDRATLERIAVFKVETDKSTKPSTFNRRAI
jgi:hypothetical protein